jgi:outer membrane protein OmpA-like peptidoglycan-associated protein
MKIILIGFLIFSGWSAISTHIFVCNIKGLCEEPLTRLITAPDIPVTLTADSLSKTAIIKIPEVPENLITYFEFDKSEFNLNAGAEKYLLDSKTYLDQNIQASLHITGYADAVGSEEYNQALGFRRAESMKNYFESNGVKANMIRIESKGEFEPADDNKTVAGRANNRRTVITIKN